MVQIDAADLVVAFQAVRHRPTLDRDAAAHGVYRGMSHGQPDRHRQLQPHDVAQRPRPLDADIALVVRCSVVPLARDLKGGTTAPRRDAQRQGPRLLGRLVDPHGHGSLWG